MGKVGSAHSLKPAVKSTTDFHDKANEELGQVYISESECSPITINSLYAPSWAAAPSSREEICLGWRSSYLSGREHLPIKGHGVYRQLANER